MISGQVPTPCPTPSPHFSRLSLHSMHGLFVFLILASLSHAAIREIAVIGERHSGTNFMGDLLRATLQHPQSVFVNHERLCGNCGNYMRQARFKHRFMFFDLLPPSGCCNLSETLIIAMLRNPFDWTISMKRHCHCRTTKHAYGANKAQMLFLNVSLTNFTSLEWAEDVFSDIPPVKPLNQPVPGFNASIGRDRTPNASPVFDNVLHMRACKLKSFLDIQKWAPHVLYVRHEDILGYRAFDWIHQMMRNYSLPRQDNLSEPAIKRLFGQADDDGSDSAFRADVALASLWKYMDRGPESNETSSTLLPGLRMSYRGSMPHVHVNESQAGSLQFEASSHRNRSIYFQEALWRETPVLRQHVANVNLLMYREVEAQAGYHTLGYHTLGADDNNKGGKDEKVLKCGWT
jgi:hypothetical protein